MEDHLIERRSEPRSIIDQYYSVEFSISESTFVYQFKIWDISPKGTCVLVKEDSGLLNRLKVGDIMNLKYYTTDSSRPIEYLETEIRHIAKDEKGRFKGLYLVGLSILDDLSSNPSG
ncbi:MAG: PilZ domain-containing protein [Desulfobacterales bacterium]|nr:PilZ domain-containing protein [Desulfobacterales bacterium]